MLNFIISYIIIKIRNFWWRFRKAIKNGPFETDKTPFYCGYVDLWKFKNVFKIQDINYEKILIKFIEYACNTEYKNRKPELNCILQFEEKNQLFSLHYYLGRRQLHVRFYENIEEKGISKSDLFSKRRLELRAHTELRPDYDPIGHLRGKNIYPGCYLIRKILTQNNKIDILD